MRQQQVRHTRNVGYKKSVKAAIKTAQAQLASKKDSKEAIEAIKKAISQIDRAVKKGVFHKNTGARKKSKLLRQYNEIAKTPFGTETPNAKAKSIKKPTAVAKTKKTVQKSASKTKAETVAKSAG